MTPMETFLQAKSLSDCESEIIEEMYLSEEDLKKFYEGGSQANSPARILWWNYARARPSGHVYYYDEIREEYLPLKYAKEDGITDPESLKFWACKNIGGGMTLMQNALALDTISLGAAIGSKIQVGTATLIGSAAGAALAAYLPDIFIPIKETGYCTKTESITEMVFHEMAHASHYTSIGSGKNLYWNREYIQMLGGWIEILSNLQSPFDNCYNDGKSEQVCLRASLKNHFQCFFRDAFEF